MGYKKKSTCAATEANAAAVPIVSIGCSETAKKRKHSLHTSRQHASSLSSLSTSPSPSLSSSSSSSSSLLADDETIHAALAPAAATSKAAKRTHSGWSSETALLLQQQVAHSNRGSSANEDEDDGGNDADDADQEDENANAAFGGSAHNPNHKANADADADADADAIPNTTAPTSEDDSEKIGERKRKHAAVEKRRREVLNIRIDEIATLLPPYQPPDDSASALREHKAEVLARATKYVDYLQQCTQQLELIKQMSLLQIEMTQEYLAKLRQQKGVAAPSDAAAATNTQPAVPVAVRVKEEPLHADYFESSPSHCTESTIHSALPSQPSSPVFRGSFSSTATRLSVASMSPPASTTASPSAQFSALSSATLSDFDIAHDQKSELWVSQAMSADPFLPGKPSSASHTAAMHDFSEMELQLSLDDFLLSDPLLSDSSLHHMSHHQQYQYQQSVQAHKDLATIPMMLNLL